MRKILIFYHSLVFLLLITSLVTTVGCQEKVKPEALVVYSSVDEENTKKLLDVFTEDTGIVVRFLHLTSGTALEQIKKEKENPQADVWLGAPNENHIIVKNHGLTVSYQSDALKNLDARYKDPEGYWYSFYINPVGLGINTDELAAMNVTIPVSWEDLLKPEYRKKIRMPAPDSSGTGFNIIASFITLWGEEKAFAYMKALGRNIPAYTTSGIGPSEATALGQCAVGIQFTPAFFKYIDQDYPIKVVFPVEGVGYEAAAVSILSGSGHIKAASKLVEWLLSQRGQTVLTDIKTYFYPVIPGAAPGPGMPDFSSLNIIDYDPHWSGENRKRLIQRWINEILPAHSPD